MRWMWIDTVTAYEPGRRMVAVKNVSLAEEHMHDHFPDQPVMPASLMVEGMAQTAGILVGSCRQFKEKVILAKIGHFTLDSDVVPGQCIRYDAQIERLDHRTGAWEAIGSAEIVFSHIDQNRSGLAFPEENFVFGENFRTLLRGAGLDRAMAAAKA
ncbi:MAG: beta-hydroxyacyl-ACP dehydratase [Planctomycetes bacterium]|nr:beta-hydroxyacyl-ACP dehydratase [Planctomycetota bacterium]